MMILQYARKVNLLKVRGKDSRRLVYHLLGLKINLFSNPAVGTQNVVKRRHRSKTAVVEAKLQ